MKNNKIRMLTLIIGALLIQGTCAYAASSTTYTKDELNNLAPGWETEDIDKSNYNVDSHTNTFSSAHIEDTTTTTTTTTTKAIETNKGNTIVSTAPSTGIKGDFWGRNSGGAWVLIEQGVPVSGWKEVRGKWYYMDSDGVMQTGWLNDGQNWYYLNSTGEMASDTFIGGYYFDSNGVMQ